MPPKKLLYLGGAITGLSDEQCNAWREEVVDRIGHIYECLNPMRRDFRGHEEEHIEEIVTSDLEDIARSHALIVNGVIPSWGTAMEIYQAYQWGKKTVAICHGKVSPWVLRHVTKVVASLDEAIPWLEAWAKE